MKHRGRPLAVIAASLLTVASCSGSTEPATENTTADTTSSTVGAASDSSDSTGSAASSSTTLDVSEQSTAGSRLSPSIGAALDLTLGWLNGQTLDEASYLTLFTDDFRAEVPHSQFVQIADQLTAQGPWTFEEVVDSTEVDLTAIVSNPSGQKAAVVVGLEDEENVVIQDLVFSPIPDAPEVASIDEALDELAEQGTVRFLAADVGDGTCQPINERDASTQMPLGSIFKLYVLAAVVEQVASGVVTWDQPVVIRDELDSLPSGTTQDVEAGTELSVRELAELMISISDNTATDHLIDLVGREVVEQAVVESGHAEPQGNVPFLTTRELFILKFAPDEDRATYIDGSVEERRELLAAQASDPLPSMAEVSVWGEPIDIETLEWFGSPLDVCQVLVQLADDEEASSILAVNPGIPDSEGRWNYLGYKGGSEPGVLAMAWIGTTAEGNEYVVVGGLANPEMVVDETSAVGLFGAARDLLADGS